MIVDLAFHEMDKYLKSAYQGSFDWSLWEFEVRGCIIEQSQHLLGSNSLIGGVEIISVENKPIGFIWASRHSNEILWIDSLVLDRKNQRQGIGKRVIRILEIRYPESTIELGVQKSNDAAFKFYSKLGFIKIADKEMEYYNTIRMKKERGKNSF